MGPGSFSFATPDRTCLHAIPEQIARCLVRRTASFNRRVQDPPYELTTNHVHLLTTPREPGGVSRMMQGIGRRYVGSFNASYRHTGTLREGRFKSALVDNERYALACHRYTELNPVRAGIVTSPWEYRWSSYSRNAHGTHEPRIAPHTAHLSLERMTTLALTPIVACSPGWTPLALVAPAYAAAVAWGSEPSAS